VKWRERAQLIQQTRQASLVQQRLKAVRRHHTLEAVGKHRKLEAVGQHRRLEVAGKIHTLEAIGKHRKLRAVGMHRKLMAVGKQHSLVAPAGQQHRPKVVARHRRHSIIQRAEERLHNCHSEGLKAVGQRLRRPEDRLAEEHQLRFKAYQSEQRASMRYRWHQRGH